MLKNIQPPETLTEEQQKAFIALRDAIADGKKQIRYIGAAGTGKSYSMAAFLKAAKEHINGDIVIAAPSHKACGVIRNFLTEQGLNLEVRTIASLVGLKKKRTKEGKEIFEPEGGETKSINAGLLVIDESSMIGENLDTWILRGVENIFQTPIIWMGDRYQLPPINEPFAPPLKRKMPEIELKTPVRYSGGVGSLCTDIRKHIDTLESQIEKIKNDPNKLQDYLKTLQKYPTPSSDFEDTESGVFVGDRSVWETNILKAFASERAKNNRDYVRIICYTNAAVAAKNKQIREHLLGKDVPEIVPGEWRITSDACVYPCNKQDSTILFPSSYEFMVEDCNKKRIDLFSSGDYPLSGIERLTLPQKLNTRSLKGRTFKQVLEQVRNNSFVWQIETGETYLKKNYERQIIQAPVTLMAIAQESIDCYQSLQQFFFDNKIWKFAFAMKDFNHQIQPIHALTAHKSQGSSFENVFVNLPDVRKNRNILEQTQLLYVAVSRAKKRVLILD